SLLPYALLAIVQKPDQPQYYRIIHHAKIKRNEEQLQADASVLQKISSQRRQIKTYLPNHQYLIDPMRVPQEDIQQKKEDQQKRRHSPSEYPMGNILKIKGRIFCGSDFGPKPLNGLPAAGADPDFSLHFFLDGC